MARKIERLTALAVTRTRREGLHADGGGLYLQVSGTGAKSWLYRFMLNGKARAMGLGSVQTISLAEAREEATQCRKLTRQGIDPIEARKAERTKAQLEAAKRITFDACATSYIEAHKSGWRNSKHAEQWRSTLDTYGKPVFGSLPVQDVDLTLVLKVLEPIWKTKTETASRLRGRIEAILDWATVRGYRQGDNPARWRGHLDKVLPARSKVQKVTHHEALPYAAIGKFIATLRALEGVAARALEFLILTAARTGEVIGARWDELDVVQKVWTVPVNRMKAGREHRVPLSTAAIAVLNTMKKLRRDEYVFPGLKKGKPLSNMAMLKLLERMGRSDLTTHGFRSTFRDWAAERTNFSREVAEMALAHTIGDKVEAAYRRGDLFEKRGELMATWEGYCGEISRPAEVTRTLAAIGLAAE